MFKILFQNKYLQYGKQYSAFDFEIEFIKGESNSLLGFLTREFLQGNGQPKLEARQ